MDSDIPGVVDVETIIDGLADDSTASEVWRATEKRSARAVASVAVQRTLGPGGGGASALDDLTDVNLGTPSDNDVLTYDSGTSKWTAAAAAGGSQPAYSSQTITAADIISRNNEDDSAAAIKITDLAPGDVLLFWWLVPGSTLDGDYSASTYFYGQADDASTDDVYNNGEQMNAVGFNGMTDGTYVQGGTPQSFGMDVVKTGAAAYVVFSGTTPPTTGEVVVNYVKWSAP